VLYLVETRVVRDVILMTNALVVLWGVKVSGEGGNLPIPADTLHEDTGALDTMLSIESKLGRFSRVKPFKHQLSVGGRSRKVFDPLAT
jgi:hypothetical protein